MLEDNTIYCGSTAVYSLSSSENGKLYVDNLNKGIAKDRGEKVNEKFAIDSRKAKVAADQAKAEKQAATVSAD